MINRRRFSNRRLPFGLKPLVAAIHWAVVGKRDRRMRRERRILNLGGMKTGRMVF